MQKTKLQLSAIALSLSFLCAQPVVAKIPVIGSALSCLLRLHQKWESHRLNQKLLRPSQHIPFDTKFHVEGKTVTYEQAIRRYAKLILTTGINLKPGMNIILFGLPEHFMGQGGEKSFAAILCEEAYSMGAKYIYFNSMIKDAEWARIEKSDVQHLGYMPKFQDGIFAEIGSSKEEWARISLGTQPIMPDMPGLSAAEQGARASTVSKPMSQSIQQLFDRADRHEMPWIVVVVPTFEYAQRFLADTTDTPLVKFYKTWQIYIELLGLHLEDPSAFWEKLSVKARQRSKRLNELSPSELHFTTPDGKTDLTVAIVQECGWSAAADNYTLGGRPFMANIPSYEIFTSPHRMKVNGRMQVSKPVIVNGKSVEGLWFEFKDGEVVSFDATKNREVIQAIFDKEPSFKRAGEIALVSRDSPINKFGRLFLNILFDENAAIHLALGSAYPLKLAHLETPAEREAAGLNESNQHVDFMFGTPDMRVEATTNDGRTLLLMDKGQFTNEIDGGGH